MAHNRTQSSITNITDSNDIHSCPICHDLFHGDHAAFENHVNSHFSDEHQDDLTPPPQDPAPDWRIQPEVLKDEAVSPSYSELFDVPNTTNLDPSTIDTEDDFKIPCEAQGCNMMGKSFTCLVWICLLLAKLSLRLL
jgi:hypothetical protein